MNAKQLFPLTGIAISAFLALTGCDGQQYVSPETVGLIIINDDTQVTRVNRCNYIPVLLGSRVEWRYTIEGDLKASLSITRSEIEVSFEGDAGEAQPFKVRPKDLEEDCKLESHGETCNAPAPPSGYVVSVQLGCVPD